MKIIERFKAARPYLFTKRWKIAWKSILSARSFKEFQIMLALDTPEGRLELAKAMVEPIKKSLMMQVIQRKCLLIDELK